MAGPAPGWYDDPTMANTRRYWDGGSWTDHRQENRAPQHVIVESAPASSAAVGWGWAFAILIPFVGFFIGLALLGRRGNDGIKIVVVSVAAFIVWAFILTSVAREDAADQCELDNIDRQLSGQPQIQCR